MPSEIGHYEEGTMKRALLRTYVCSIGSLDIIGERSIF